MDYGIVIGLFDFKVGPYAVFFRDVTKDVASKIVIKGTIFQGSLQTSSSSGESIISFPSQLASAYIYLFLQEENGKEFPILIAFITDIKDQSSLYRDAEELRRISTSIINEITSVKDFSSNSNLPKEILNIMESKYNQNLLNSILFRNIHVTQNDQQFSLDDFQIKPLNLISLMIKKNLDQVIYGLIIGIPIVIHGKDLQLIKLTIKTFELISPHRKLKTSLIYEDESIEREIQKLDIIGTTTSVKANKYYILIDLEKGIIKGGRKNNYCEKMLNDLVEAEEKNTILLQMLANRRINWLLTFVSTLTQVENEKAQKDAIKGLTNKLDRDSLFLIAKLVEEKNPLIFKHIINSTNFRTRFFKSIF
jgi:hypothetical protein